METELSNSLHKGHRRRLKQRFLVSEGEGFNEHELLELLLFYAVPRRNTNDTAHRLIERFGSVNSMAEASLDELRHVYGVGNDSAIIIKTILLLAKAYAKQEQRSAKRIESLKDAAEVANSFIMGAIKEVAFCIFVDNYDNLIDISAVAIGSINEVKPIIRNVIELSILKRATSVYFVHNHPSGCLIPSQSDIEFTSLLKREMEIIGIRLEDHLIVDGRSYRSIKEHIRDLFCEENCW